MSALAKLTHKMSVLVFPNLLNFFLNLLLSLLYYLGFYKDEGKIIGETSASGVEKEMH